MLTTGRDEQNLSVATTAESLVRAVNFSAKKRTSRLLPIAERKQLREFDEAFTRFRSSLRSFGKPLTCR